MRIGFVTGEYPPMQGGVGDFTHELSKAFTELGHKVYIFTRELCSSAGDSEIGISPIVSTKWDWRSIRMASEWATSQRLDVVNIQFQTAAFDMLPAIHFFPRRIGLPVVTTFHDLREPFLFPKAHCLGLRKWVVRYLAASSTSVIATNRPDELILTDQWSVPNVARIPIGSNVSITPPLNYLRSDWRDNLGLSPKDLLISYFGFLNKSKGGLFLIEALAKLLETGLSVHLVMIGGRVGETDQTSMDYGSRVDAAIERMGITNKVHWTGFVDSEVVSAHLLASDITVLPFVDGVSLRRGTLMAALAHGRAIVTTAPQHEIPELESAIETVPTPQPQVLADTILALWQDDIRRRQLEESALMASQNFTWSTIAAQTEEHFNLAVQLYAHH